jgi:hypothetical protein
VFIHSFRLSVDVSFFGRGRAGASRQLALGVLVENELIEPPKLVDNQREVHHDGSTR